LIKEIKESSFYPNSIYLETTRKKRVISRL